MMMMPEQGPPGLCGLDFVPDQPDIMKGWWRIIWCHERCHKQQNDELRHKVRKVAQMYGASLICLKKSRQFAVWMERAPKTPYVLVTDWREAQPSMQAIAQQHAQKHPMLTVVLCDSKRQAIRATEWARALRPEFGKVQVCESSCIPPSLLGGLIYACFGCGDKPDMTKTIESVPPPFAPCGPLAVLPGMPGAPCDFGGDLEPEAPQGFALSDYLGDFEDVDNTAKKVDLGEPMYCGMGLHAPNSSAWSVFDARLQESRLAVGCGSTDTGSEALVEDGQPSDPSEEELPGGNRSSGQAVCQTLWKQSCLLATSVGTGNTL
jgi:hypothetical protein